MNRSTTQMIRTLTGLCGIAAFFTATNSFANPYVEGSTIRWDQPGWFQVQSAVDFRSHCEGGSSCEVPDGTYTVINLSSGQRWMNIEVNQSGGSVSGSSTASASTDSAYPFQINGSEVTFPASDWYQVQRADNYNTVCEGDSQCRLSAGTYNVINHSNGARYDGVVIGGTASSSSPATGGTSNSAQESGTNPVVVGNRIELSGSGWYQVQTVGDWRTVCEGSLSFCDVAPGVYSVINHSSGQRFDDIQVGGAVGAPTVTGPAATPSSAIYTYRSADPFNRSLENTRSAIPADGRPSQPQNLRVELIANDWVEINWAPSVDNGEVVSYNIYRDNTNSPLYVISRGMVHPNGGIAAELAKYWETTSFIDCNRTRFSDAVYFCDGGANGEPARGPEPGSAHTYYVSAVDNRGNESDLSEPLDVQLYPFSGGEVQTYLDPHLMGPDAFPFNTNISRPASFVGDLQLVFNEEFNGSELDSSRWNTRLSWGPNVVINGEKQYFVDTMNSSAIDYDPFSFTGSTMKIAATKTPAADLGAANGQRYLSGALSSHDKFGFTYGYVESRMKVSGVFGALSTVYLYHRWPGDHAPEIDIAEYLGYNQFGDEDMFQTYHYRDVNYADNGWTRSTPTMSERNDSGALHADAFHTYGLLWEPGLIIWYIDGVEVKRLHGPQVGRRQMNIVTYLVTGSNWTKAPDEYTASDELVERRTDSVVNLPFKLERDHPVEMEIDYIRVWQLPGRTG